ncbi:hypothetical protein IPH25_03100 [bacterium]|nr:MAG: hypothetical protein IPG37_00090 [bacterium]QQR61454.1 MAG: hypothetical protein IPH25_03100 [bacterium]QQR63020.1 MAG: hypothetical protein IPH67_00910 [bacterium]
MQKGLLDYFEEIRDPRSDKKHPFQRLCDQIRLEEFVEAFHSFTASIVRNGCFYCR